MNIKDDITILLASSSASFEWGPPSFKSIEEKLWDAGNCYREELISYPSTRELEFVCDVLNEAYGRNLHYEISGEQVAMMYNETHFIYFDEIVLSGALITETRLRVYKRQ